MRSVNFLEKLGEKHTSTVIDHIIYEIKSFGYIFTADTMNLVLFNLT